MRDRDESREQPGGRPRVLATDNRPEALRLVERSLGDGYEYEFATDVAEARAKLGGRPFQLALCDVRKPAEAGLELAEEISRAHRGTAIVLTADVDEPEIVERALRLGAQAYLVKPFWPGQLRVAATNALRQHHLETEQRARQAALLGSDQERAEALRHELIAAQRQAIEQIGASRQEVVERLAAALETHRPEAADHLHRVAVIAAFLGEEAGLGEERVRLLRAATPMHDVGKIAIPDGVLQKHGPLTPSERKRMEAHTTIGHRILAESESDLLATAAAIALSHHERYDGSGYPGGLAGEEIPLEGRIVAVADAFDSLLSERPHRPAAGVPEAREAILAGRGTHFDPEIVDALVENLDEVLALRGRRLPE